MPRVAWCPYVFVWGLRLRAASADSEALMLKDVSSFLCMAPGSSGVPRQATLMSRMCHCRKNPAQKLQLRKIKVAHLAFPKHRFVFFLTSRQ